MGLARRDLRDFWGALNLSGDPARVRDELLLFFPELVQAYGDTAAVLGADWYDLLRDVPASADSFKAILAAPVTAAHASDQARWAVGPLFEENADEALARLSNAVQWSVMKPARDSFAGSSWRDPVRTAWARVPSGATTCRWCVMLASRGADYADAVSAGRMNEFHSNCDCVQVPIRSASDWPAGHSVEFFRKLYADHSGVGRDLTDY